MSMIRHRRTELATKTVTATMARRLIPQPVLSFRIHPDDTHRYFLVEIYRTERQLAKMRSLHFPEKKLEVVWAFTDIQVAYGNRLGVICLSLRAATDRIIAHECLHAAMHWAALKRLPGCMIWGHRNHERLALALDELVSGFWEQFTGAGYERKECWGWTR